LVAAGGDFVQCYEDWNGRALAEGSAGATEPRTRIASALVGEGLLVLGVEAVGQVLDALHLLLGGRVPADL
jgi:hypothetical protein